MTDYYTLRPQVFAAVRYDGTNIEDVRAILPDFFDNGDGTVCVYGEGQYAVPAEQWFTSLGATYTDEDWTAQVQPAVAEGVYVIDTP